MGDHEESWTDFAGEREDLGGEGDNHIELIDEPLEPNPSKKSWT